MMKCVGGPDRGFVCAGPAAGQGVQHLPQFWLNGQLALDLYKASHDEEELRELERIEPVSH